MVYGLWSRMVMVIFHGNYDGSRYPGSMPGTAVVSGQTWGTGIGTAVR